MENTSKEYQSAYEAHNLACKAFAKVTDDYRAMNIGDSEYLDARKIYDAATNVFDAAFAKESK